ncbi:GNAT family N-acetyltransferase [[Eubacterium] cellulosolvens]
MPDIEVRELKEKEFDLWDRFVESSPYGTIFHKSYWLKTISGSLGKKLRFFGYFEDGELVGGCSLYIFIIGFLKLASSTMKMTPYNGILLSESPSSKVRKQESGFKTIIDSLCSEFEKEFDYIRIANSPRLIDIRPFIWNRWESEVFYEYDLNLKDDIRKHISKNARYLIRKAIKNKITPERLSALDLSAYYELFSMTYQRQNLDPPVSKNFLETIFSVLEAKNIGEMWIAKTSNGDIASSEIIILDNERAHCWTSANHTDFRKTGSNALLLYEISKDLMKRRIKELNLAAANTPHLAYYWTNFNPELIPYYCVIKKNMMAKIGESVFRKLSGIK